MDWEKLISRLAPLRTRWDVAVLANLADSDGPVRPADLIKAINTQSCDGQITWKVIEDTLRRLEASAYIGRREVPRGPRETHYWLLPRGRRLIGALDLLDASYNDEDPGADGDALSG